MIDPGIFWHDGDDVLTEAMYSGPHDNNMDRENSMILFPVSSVEKKPVFFF